MTSNSTLVQKEVVKSISRDRVRTNILWKYEQATIAYLVQRIPEPVTSNMLTAVGFFGNVIVFLGFILAPVSNYFLMLGIPGFAISWFGDSLDGRLAYYRNKPRKNYGHILDITVDYINIILVGLGYIIYVEGIWELLGYGFVVMYGWEMLMALMRFKLTGNYSIDSGKLGPTEARIVVAIIMVVEVFLPGSIVYSVSLAFIMLLIINIRDTIRLLDLADSIDKKTSSRR
jgi:phosphatidylglycerophosphate synthase